MSFYRLQDDFKMRFISFANAVPGKKVPIFIEQMDIRVIKIIAVMNFLEDTCLAKHVSHCPLKKKNGLF